jgi:hypothetical protein
MMGNFAESVIFICGMLAWLLLFASLLCYVSYCISVVVSDTSAGVDEVQWPGDAMIDWIGQALRLVVVLVVLLVPLGFYLRFFGGSLDPSNPAGGAIAVAAGWLWFSFPIGLLSSMAAGQPFVVVHPTVLWRLLRIFPSVILFYALSALCTFAIVYTWCEAVMGSDLLLIPVAGAITGIGVLIYARMIGRLGWMAERLQVKEKVQKLPPGKLKPKERKKVKVTDPWAAPPASKRRVEPEEEPRPVAKIREIPLPPEEEDEFAPATPYGLNDEPVARPPKLELIEGSPFLEVKLKPAPPTSAEPPPARSRFIDDDDDEEDIQVGPSDVVVADTRPSLDVAPSALDMRLARPERQELDLSFPLFTGVYNFPFYMTSLRALLVISVSSAALGFALEALIRVFPH